MIPRIVPTPLAAAPPSTRPATGKPRRVANEVIDKLVPCGLLVLDNCHWFIDHPTRSPYSRNGRGNAEPHWDRFVERVAGWRRIWTSAQTFSRWA